jgi:HlyD family secretion protein
MTSEKATLDRLRIDRDRRPSRRPGWLLPAAVAAVIGVAMVAWWLLRPGATVVEAVVARASTGATSSQRTTVLNASGYVTARRAATVSSKVTGKVVEVSVEEGKKVEANQVLARLDSSNVEAALRLSEAQLERTRRSADETMPNLEFAQGELRRFQSLAATKVVSDSDLRRTEAEAKALAARLARQKSEIAVAEREVAQWKQQLDDTIVRAPFEGVVTTKNAQPGEMISPMSVGGFTRTGICTIVDMTSLEIEVDVNESYINRVKPGLPVEAILDAYPDWRIPAKVIAIIPTADRQKATVKVRVSFDQLDPRILPDMGVKVAFQNAAVEKAPASTVSHVIVPKSAVQQSDGRDVVWVMQGRRVERRAVTIGRTERDESTISAGLNAGERVVINPPAGLSDGGRVTEKK